ncbi:MAG TPA: 50S ribosomal protein L10 [Candidatus Nanoarchaeia archaeon]|nr:50S ribosomal protein L10 [uncultured archaeon]
MDEEKKPASRIKKEQTVAQLREKLSRAKTVVLADQSGLSVSKIGELKKKLKGVDAEILVAKNTLLKIAAREAGYEVPDETLVGPTAALFAYDDEVAPLRELSTFAKENEKPSVKVGFLGKTLLSVERIAQLGRLPSKEVLHRRVVGSLYSPLYGVVSVLNANLKNLVYALDQIKASKVS